MPPVFGIGLIFNAVGIANAVSSIALMLLCTIVPCTYILIIILKIFEFGSFYGYFLIFIYNKYLYEINWPIKYWWLILHYYACYKLSRPPKILFIRNTNSKSTTKIAVLCDRYFACLNLFQLLWHTPLLGKQGKLYLKVGISIF